MEKKLFTPGPLTTSARVKQAMLRDVGSREPGFLRTVQAVRESLLEIAGVSKRRGYEAVLMQGSGTFGIEAVISSVIPTTGKLLVISNGAYGERLFDVAAAHDIDTTMLRFEEDTPPSPPAVETVLEREPSVTHVAMVHCETSTGMINPVQQVGLVVQNAGKSFLLDSMSAFGAVPIDLEACGVDFLVSSANKCLEGVPGFAFVICRREALTASEGRARSLSLDLLEQWRGFEKNGQFRFTPPTHALLAFQQALGELEQEGGVPRRAARYRSNHGCLVEGMRDMGFQEYLPRELQGYIITSFRYPADPRFEFDEFYRRLSDRGCVIYPGKVSHAECFRIGTIGGLFTDDVRALLDAVRASLREMGVETGRPAGTSRK